MRLLTDPPRVRVGLVGMVVAPRPIAGLYVRVPGPYVQYGQTFQRGTLALVAAFRFGHFGPIDLALILDVDVSLR